jgi:hypothetical protein
MHVGHRVGESFEISIHNAEGLVDHSTINFFKLANSSVELGDNTGIIRNGPYQQHANQKNSWLSRAGLSFLKQSEC